MAKAAWSTRRLDEGVQAHPKLFYDRQSLVRCKNPSYRSNFYTIYDLGLIGIFYTHEFQGIAALMTESCQKLAC